MQLIFSLLLLCCSSIALASSPPSGSPPGAPAARYGPSGTVIDVPVGAVVTLLDASEEVVTTVTATGPVTLARDGVDPMLRILRIEHPSSSWIGPLSDLLPAAELVGVLPEQVKVEMRVT